MTAMTIQAQMERLYTSTATKSKRERLDNDSNNITIKGEGRQLQQ